MNSSFQLESVGACLSHACCLQPCRFRKIFQQVPAKTLISHSHDMFRLSGTIHWQPAAHSRQPQTNNLRGCISILSMVDSKPYNDCCIAILHGRLHQVRVQSCDTIALSPPRPTTTSGPSHRCCSSSSSLSSSSSQSSTLMLF
jgi:hypothetical protein